MGLAEGVEASHRHFPGSITQRQPFQGGARGRIGDARGDGIAGGEVVGLVGGERILDPRRIVAEVAHPAVGRRDQIGMGERRAFLDGLRQLRHRSDRPQPVVLPGLLLASGERLQHAVDGTADGRGGAADRLLRPLDETREAARPDLAGVGGNERDRGQRRGAEEHQAARPGGHPRSLPGRRARVTSSLPCVATLRRSCGAPPSRVWRTVAAGPQVAVSSIHP